MTLEPPWGGNEVTKISFADKGCFAQNGADLRKRGMDPAHAE